MRFFEQQALARKNTRLLTLAFIVNVILLSVINAVWVGLYFHFEQNQVIMIFSASCLVFIVATAIGMSQVRRGTHLAEWLGGRPLRLPTTDLAEKRLFNVVEEMSIASGVPIPFIYILDADDSINAFAAGTDPKSVVIAVTRGALVKLTREELQAVVGHEFSHILNEDMDLNVRLAGVVSGFYVFMRMGYFILRGSSSGRRSYSSGKKGGGGGGGPILIAGLSFLIFGSVGYLLGRILQAMVSRQREYLADASSVQFTRNPEALAKALAKIGYHSGSEISSANRMEMAHIFFAEGVSGFWGSMISTHPPIDKRIQTLIPRVQLKPFIESMRAEFTAMEKRTSEWIAEENERFENKVKAQKPAAEQKIQNRNWDRDFLATVATPAMGHFRYTESALRQIPDDIRKEIQDPAKAKVALLSVVLLTQDPQIRESFFEAVGTQSPADVSGLKKYVEFAERNPRLKFIFFKIVLGVLRQQPLDFRKDLLENLERFFKQDEKFTLIEAVYFVLCESILGTAPGVTARQPLITDLRLVQNELYRLLMASEYEELTDSEFIKKYTQKLAARIPLFSSGSFSSPKEYRFKLEQFKKDLERLNQVELKLKQKLAQIIFDNFKADQNLSDVESDLMRMVFLMLKIPLPPLIDQALNGIEAS